MLFAKHDVATGQFTPTVSGFTPVGVGFNGSTQPHGRVGAGVGLTVGPTVGLAVGSGVGLAVGLVVGPEVGLAVGLTVGSSVGLVVGFTVGSGVGLLVGFTVGSGVGFGVVGAGDGNKVLEVGGGDGGSGISHTSLHPSPVRPARHPSMHSFLTSNWCVVLSLSAGRIGSEQLAVNLVPTIVRTRTTPMLLVTEIDNELPL